jgi:hypothetical protein
MELKDLFALKAQSDQIRDAWRIISQIEPTDTRLKGALLEAEMALDKAQIRVGALMKEYDEEQAAKAAI